MARRNIWEQIWESTEGPTVTVTIPRDHAESLLRVLASSLEEEMPDDVEDGDDDGMDDLDFGGDEEGGDDDDIDAMADLDLDLPAGDEDDDEMFDEPSPPKKPKKKGPEKSKKDDDDKDDEDEDKKEEGADPNSDGLRQQTALGESAFSRAARAMSKPHKRS